MVSRRNFFEQHNNTKSFCTLILIILSLSLSLSITLFCSLLIKVLSYFDRKRDNTHHEIVFAKTRIGRTIIITLVL